MYLRARLGLGYLPQEASVFKRLTAEENIMAVLETLPLDEEERKSRLENLLEEFRIGSVRSTSGDSLSGGERRRVEIARCLASEPEFILLDEPFAGIDPIAIDDLRQIITQLKEKGIGILITDHNVRETLGITNRAYIMADGRILKHGTPSELLGDEDVRRFYLGESFSL
jgi:lipopolysaccharide export system ATP-binding protein